MPSNPERPEQPRMITLVATAPDGSRARLRFPTAAEAAPAAERLRATGHRLAWRLWSETLGRTVTIPED